MYCTIEGGILALKEASEASTTATAMSLEGAGTAVGRPTGDTKAWKAIKVDWKVISKGEMR